MAAHAGVKIRGESDLLFTLDSASQKSAEADKNLLWDWYRQWAISTGSSTGFGQNGDGNSRILDTDPYGATSIVWDVSNQDSASNADGGWNGSLFNIDNTKTYRFSCWVRRKNVGNGSFYLGLRGYTSSNSHTGVIRRDNGADSQTNPYFHSRGWWGSANTWYYVVGHVWPVGSGTGAAHPDSGIFDVDGNKVASVNRDYVWRSDTAKSLHRTYLYYSTNTSTNQQWWNPRVEIVADAPNISVDYNSQVRPKIFAPGVQRLIKKGIGGRWNLRNPPTETAGTVSLRKVQPSSDGFIFGGGDDDKSIQVPLAGNFNKLEGTITAWVYPYSYSGSNGIFVNRDNTGTNSADWLWMGVWSSGSTFYLRIGQSGSCCSNDLTFGSASSVIPVNTWTQVTCSWKSGGSSYIYINGVQKTTRTISTIPNTSPSSTGRIGLGHDSSSTGSWNGKIDAFKIFGRQLTADEIYDNYVATRTRFGN